MERVPRNIIKSALGAVAGTQAVLVQCNIGHPSASRLVCSSRASIFDAVRRLYCGGYVVARALATRWHVLLIAASCAGYLDCLLLLDNGKERPS